MLWGLQLNVFAAFFSLVPAHLPIPDSTDRTLPRFRSVATDKIKPKVFIISLYSSEGETWYNIPQFDILAHNITIPGLFPQFPDAHCTADASICQLTTGQGEVNAAISITTLLHAPFFDLTSTYFMIAGVGGVNPKHATIASVTFARFAVQVALQYEIDAREIPSEFPTGYFPQGSRGPGHYPGMFYGTEVYEVNDALRKLAVQFASTATLFDTEAAQAYRKHYETSTVYAAGASPPSIVECDTATSDAFWSGALLGEAFENTTAIFTNGSAVYCTTQQEDNAVLGALSRGSLWKAVDFSRIIVMRAASDFDRPFKGQSAVENLFSAGPGYAPSLRNLHLVGVKVVQGIIDGWQETFEQGVPPVNYVGDVLGSLPKASPIRVRLSDQTPFDT